MGLDMCLSAQRYTSEYSDKEANQKLLPLANLLLPPPPPPDRSIGSITISRGVAYWRKANQIHSWFVTNVQEGNDDCSTYDVSREQLDDLLSICVKIVDGSELKKGKVVSGYTLTAASRKPIREDGWVVTNHELAMELLPPIKGFFFGSQEVDGFYIDQIKDTIEQLTKVLAWCDAEQALVSQNAYSNVDFQYHSSW